MTVRRVGICVTVFVICLAFGSKQLMASYEEALELYKEKKYTESIKIIAQGLNPAEDMNPEAPNYKLRYLAAHNYWQIGNIQSVVAHFRRCMNIKKDTVDPYIDLAFFYFDKKYYRDSEVTASRGLKIKESSLLYYILGKIALVRKNYWQAKALFEKANSMDPELYISYNALGTVLVYLNKYSEANTAFLVARALKIDSYEILNNLGLSYEGMGDVEKALGFYKKAAEINEDNSVIQNNIARIESRDLK